MSQPVDIEDLYLKNRDKFLRWASKRYLLSDNDAAEIYQDAILIMYERLVEKGVLLLKAKQDTYLFGIAKNLIAEKGRKEARMVADHAFVEVPLEEDVDEENLRNAEQALEELEEPCQTILRQFYYHRKSLREIATLIGHSDEKVTKTQKARCMNYLRELFQKQTKANGF